MAHPVALQFGEKLLGALLIEVLDAVSAAGRDDLEVFGIFVQQPGHKGTSLLLQVAQNPHLVGKARIGLRTAEGLVHPAIVANTNGRSEGVLDLVHVCWNMAHRGREASLDEASSRSWQDFQSGTLFQSSFWLSDSFARARA